MTPTSQLNRIGHVRPDDLNGEQRKYDPLRAYCDSKLANLQFSLELQRRLDRAGSSVRSVAAHPGIASTNLAADARGISGFIDKRMGWAFNDAELGALPTPYAVTQDVPGVHKPSRRGSNAEQARELWETSARLTGVQDILAVGH